MARSRCGGSHSLLSGKVGSVIYSITRNADGSFRQSVSSNPEERFNPNTDAQARARLTMATIERAMFTYADFMGTGFEGVELGTACVSKFSEINYNNIKSYLADWWEEGEWNETQWDLPLKGNVTPRDGEFIISRGSLKSYNWFTRHQCTANMRQFGIESPALGTNVTVSRWLSRVQLRPGMQMVNIFFCNGNTRSTNFVAYITVWIDDNVDRSAILNSNNWRRYINVSSNVPVNAYWNNERGQLFVLCTAVDQLGIRSTGTIGTRYRVRENGRFRYNNCEMQWSLPYWPWENPGWNLIQDVKPSWMI